MRTTLFGSSTPRRSISEAARDDRWDQRAYQVLLDDLNRAHHMLAAEAVQLDAAGDGAQSDAVLSPHSKEMARFTTLLKEIRDDDPVSLSGLSVVVREVTLLASRLNGQPNRTGGP